MWKSTSRHKVRYTLFSDAIDSHSPNRLETFRSSKISTRGLDNERSEVGKKANNCGISSTRELSMTKKKIFITLKKVVTSFFLLIRPWYDCEKRILDFNRIVRKKHYGWECIRYGDGILMAIGSSYIENTPHAYKWIHSPLFFEKKVTRTYG